MAPADRAAVFADYIRVFDNLRAHGIANAGALARHYIGRKYGEQAPTTAAAPAVDQQLLQQREEDNQ